MKSFKTITLLLITLCLVAAAYVWFFIWNKPKTNVANAESIKTEAVTLFNEYSTNEQAANIKYLEKVLEVTGVVTSITINAEGLAVILLQSDDPVFGINCTMEEIDSKIKKGDRVTLKGICTGYLTDVVLIRCYKIK
jgi:hypothetical protein